MKANVPSRLNRVFFLAVVFATLSASATSLATTAYANDYPARPITVVVGWPPGGATDANARLLTQAMAKDLGATIVVENKSGAGGSIGSAAVARAQPDGYTITYIASSNVITSLLVKYPTYGIAKDLEPVSQSLNEPLVLLVNNEKGVSSVAELVALAKRSPETFNYASTGNGGILHLAAADFLQQMDIKGTQVPYRGTAPALTDLIGNQVQMFFGTLSDAYPLVNGNKLKALAVTGTQRSSLLPDVPTLSEAIGKDSSEKGTWQGFLVPKGTPSEIIDRLQKSINTVLADPAIRARIIGKGLEPVGGTARAFDERIQLEIETRGRSIERMGITSVQ